MSTEHQKFKQFLEGRKLASPNYEEQAFSVVKRLQAKAKRPGRPSKREDEKVRLVSMKLAPDTLQELRDLPFGVGVGSKVRELLSYFKYQERKQIAQAKLLQKLLVPFDAHLHSYLKMAKGNARSSEALTLLEELLQLSKKIRMTVDLLHWEGRDFKAYLRADQVSTLHFALDFKRETCENRAFQQIL